MLEKSLQEMSIAFNVAIKILNDGVVSGERNS